MHSTVIKTRAGNIHVGVLRPGDAATVQAVFDGLGERSRQLRFGAAKPTLTQAELEQLSRVDGSHHVLVARLDGTPVGIARLVRDESDRTCGELAAAVVDEWQRRGIGTALVRLLLADAAAAGITHVHAAIALENRGSLRMLAKAATIVRRRLLGGGETDVVALTA